MRHNKLKHLLRQLKEAKLNRLIPDEKIELNSEDEINLDDFIFIEPVAKEHMTEWVSRYYLLGGKKL